MQPEVVARKIVAGINGRFDVVYAPTFWRWIMLTIRCIPNSIFKRMKL